jgi:hypothetical protein
VTFWYGSGSAPLTTDPDFWIRLRIRTSYYWIRIQEAQKHTDPTDPNPQHWIKIKATGKAAAHKRLMNQLMPRAEDTRQWSNVRGCSEALLVRWPSVWQSRVRISARHPREVFPSEQQAMKKWREASANEGGWIYCMNVIINVWNWKRWTK